LAAAGLWLAACSWQPRPPPPSNDIDEGVYREALGVLASDDFEGRKPGTPGEQKTVAYLADRFKRLGLKPGIGESYLQPVPMVEVAVGKDSRVGVRGPGHEVSLGLGMDAVVWTRRQDAQVSLADSELVFVGYGIVAREFNWNDYAGVDVRGKTVMVRVEDPGYGTHDPKTFKGGAMTYYGRWAYKVDEAARQGAAAVLLVHDAAALGFGWSVVQNTWGGPQLALAASTAAPAAVNAPPAKAPPIATPLVPAPPVPALEGWLRKETARSMLAAAGLDFDASAKAAAQPGFKALSTSLRVHATLHDAVRTFISSNVIAKLPGTAHHSECVVYVAHWDGLGRDRTRTGHDIFNGATENASGVAGLLALAQSFQRTKPAAEREILFVAATGGGARPLGSEYYVSNPAVPLRDTAAAFDLDALARGGPTRNLILFNPGNTDLEEFGRGAALLEGREVTPDPNPEWGAYYNSDSLAFADAGVPVLFVRAGLDDSARGPAYGRAQLDDYMQNRYRQPTDQYSADWDVRGALDDLKLYFEVGNRVARGRRFPRWLPNSEFHVSRHPSQGPAEGHPPGSRAPETP
ncbi:MAG TPA: M28 family peptidase, partial [Steroidobacteraceae bacterium]|nr:M28 family peptidase [Steroidobacteraceae bacterium]